MAGGLPCRISASREVGEMMIPANTNDDHGPSESSGPCGEGRRDCEKSGRSVTAAKLCIGGNEKGAAPSLAALVRAGAGEAADSGTARDGVLSSTAITPARPMETKKSAIAAIACSDEQARTMLRTGSIARMGVAV